jgi:hypothetical protein
MRRNSLFDLLVTVRDKPFFRFHLCCYIAAGAFAATEGEDLSQILIAEQLASKCALSTVPVGVARPALHYYERDILLSCRETCGRGDGGDKFALLAKEFSDLFIL